MEKFLHKYIFHISFVLFLVSFIVFSSQVSAFGRPAVEGFGHGEMNGEFHKDSVGSDWDHESTSAAQPHFPPNHNWGDNSASEEGKFANKHLDNIKLKVCEAVSKNILKRSDNMNKLATTMEKVFDSIAQGMENYYLNDLVPQGKIVPNYDTLVADIQTQKAALDPLLAKVQADIAGFDCNSNNPMAQLTQYRADLQAVIQGLKAYRTAVRNLIVAITTAQGVASSGKDASGSAEFPSPTISQVTPTPSPVIPTPTP